MHDESKKPTTVRTVDVGEHRVRFHEGEATLVEPIHMPLGRVERDGKQWKATARDGSTHDAHSRHLATMWLIEDTADERAKLEAEYAERAAARQAETERRDAEQSGAAEVALSIIRAVRPDYELPGGFLSGLFAFSPAEMCDLLTALVKPGPRVLPTAEAVEYLAEKTVVLCQVASATAEDPMPEPHPWLWGFLVGAHAYVERDQAFVNFAFEGARADEFNEIELPCLGATAVVSQDAVTFADLEGGFLVALIAEGADTLEIAGLDGMNDEWNDRDSVVALANGPEPEFWTDIPDDEIDPGDHDDAPAADEPVLDA